MLTLFEINYTLSSNFSSFTIWTKHNLACGYICYDLYATERLIELFGPDIATGIDGSCVYFEVQFMKG